jgi:hypothetical protein
MKVNPSLFPANSVPPRQNGDVSEARRAFEAMLSASAARSRGIQSSSATQDGTLAIPVRNSGRLETALSSEMPAQLSRPGRVLDIKV